jgi:hypothetical protein
LHYPVPNLCGSIDQQRTRQCRIFEILGPVNGLARFRIAGVKVDNGCTGLRGGKRAFGDFGRGDRARWATSMECGWPCDGTADNRFNQSIHSDDQSMVAL